VQRHQATSGAFQPALSDRLPASGHQLAISTAGRMIEDAHCRMSMHEASAGALGVNVGPVPLLR